MVFQKDLTPFAKGGTVKKQRGKGASTFRPDPTARMTGRYPKVAPEPAAPPGQMVLPGMMGPPRRPEDV